MVGVGEEDGGNQGERFEDVELEYRNADMTGNDVDKVCQADRECGPEEDLCSLGYAWRTGTVRDNFDS